MGTWILGSCIGGCFLLAAHSVYRNRKQGGCCGGCKSCAFGERCGHK